ncbi:MAG: potassium channel family protein [Candidatus Palauibacterales bacterium]|nr:potassium channel family protein [Candidatus Palauibacterales bacterium]
MNPAGGSSPSLTRRAARATLAGRFGALFWLLVVTIAVPVVVPDGPIIQRSMTAVLFIAMLSGLRAISRQRRQLIGGMALALPAVVLSVLSLGLEVQSVYVWSLALYGLFFGFLAVQILLHTLRQTEVDAETIYGAVNVYLLMALFWTMAYLGVAIASPGSFHYPDTEPLNRIQAERLAMRQSAVPPAIRPDWSEAREHAQGTFMYFSFVTLTTLGYGDLYPESDAARILAMLEATLGQLYLVILVARLVGLYTAQETERRKRPPPT